MALTVTELDAPGVPDTPDPDPDPEEVGLLLDALAMAFAASMMSDGVRMDDTLLNDIARFISSFEVVTIDPGVVEEDNFLKDAATLDCPESRSRWQ